MEKTNLKKEIELKHYFIFKDHKMRYLCNQACLISKDKITNDYFEVTCKNCKEILTKERIRIEVNKALSTQKQEFKKMLDELDKNAFYRHGDEVLKELKQKLRR